MKIRNGLVLAMAILFGLTGCASGGGGGGTTLADLMAESGEGERPRNTEMTRAAERALDEAADAEDADEASMHYEEALTAAEGAIAEDGTNPLGHRLAALAALGLERYQEAGAHFDRANELRPVYEIEVRPIREQTWIDLYNEASPAVSSGDYETAVEIFENAHAIYQGRPEIMIILGQLHAQLGNHPQSLDYMAQAMAFIQDPDNVAVADSATLADWQDQAAVLPELRAQVLAADEQYEAAAEAYRELSEQDPTNLDYVRSRAAVLMQGGDEAGALAVYEDLLTRPGLSGLDYYAIGVGFYQADDYERAARAFEGAAGVNGRDRDSIEMWARSLSLDSVYAEVPPVAQQWIELDPSSRNAWLILAQAANRLEDSETTQEAVQGMESLEVSVDQLQLRRMSSGGGTVSGQVVNLKRAEGSSVTLRFTFYGTDGAPLGSVTESVTLAGTDMAQVFTVDFSSGEQVGGYSYEITG